MKKFVAKYNIERFNEFLDSTELNQAELANKLNTTQPNIFKLSKGLAKDISANMREAIQMKFGVNPAYFYNLSDEFYLKNSEGKKLEAADKKFKEYEAEINELKKEIVRLKKTIDLQFKELDRAAKYNV